MNKILASIQNLWTGNLSREEAARLNEAIRNKDAGLRKELHESFYESTAQQQSSEDYDEASEMFNKLLVKISRTADKRARVIFIVKSSMGWAAALIVLAFTAEVIYNLSQKKAHVNAIVGSVKDTSPLKSVTNNTKDKMTVALRDGSVVTLFSNSTISYREKFDEKARNITLEGMARFKVAKDAHKPFIVLSNGFTTTALGTEFSVDTRKAGNVEVILFEGKVVVRSVHKDLYLKRDVYLTPMHSFTANISAGEFVVSKFNAEKNLPANRKGEDRLGELPKEDLEFNNEPLENVFDKLNEKFNANIKYTSRQLKGLHFTGTIFQTDSLKTIVTIISRMNDLTFEEQDGYILIHQKK